MTNFPCLNNNLVNMYSLNGRLGLPGCMVYLPLDWGTLGFSMANLGKKKKTVWGIPYGQ